MSLSSAAFPAQIRIELVKGCEGCYCKPDKNYESLVDSEMCHGDRWESNIIFLPLSDCIYLFPNPGFFIYLKCILEHTIDTLFKNSSDITHFATNIRRNLMYGIDSTVPTCIIF